MSNIVGAPHLEYVQEQIKTRQEILGKKDRSSQDLTWMNNNNSWIRLVSSVNIGSQDVYQFVSGSDELQLLSNNGEEFRENLLGLDNYGGNKLSSELILQGGAQKGNSKRFGVAETNSTLPSENFNYGYGGLDFGLKPIPGIQSFNSKTYNNGSLREAQITILAHNKNQFEYIESTYLRLGYTMLLEWGNSAYPKNSSEYSNTQDLSQLSLKNKFLDDQGSGPNYFYTEIEKLRKISKGNYDGFLGTVKNFSWEFNKEQQYVINLTLITIGSVIESLKINLPSSTIKYPPKELEEGQDNAQQGFQNALINLIQIVATPDPFNTEDEEIKKIPYIKGIPFFGSNSYIDNRYKPIKYADDGLTAVACFANYGNNKFIRYIKFETLLELINDNLLIYNNEGDPTLIRIDTSDELYCYSNGFSISADPSKMLIGFKKDTNELKANIFNLTLPFFHDTVNEVQVGKIKNLFFTSEYLIQEIKDNTDKDENLNLFDFLNGLLSTANNLLGGVNKLKIKITDKEFKLVTNTDNDPDQVAESKIEQVIEIYDEVQPYKRNKLFPNSEKPSIFKILGVEPDKKGGFVTDFSLKTELTKDLQTMIAIGAQANGSAVGEDATIFSKWNVGLIDRIIPNKKDSDQLAQSLENAQKPLEELSDITTKYFSYVNLFQNSVDNLESSGITPEDQQRRTNAENELKNLEGTDKKTQSRKRELEDLIDGIQKEFFTGYGFPDVNLGTVEGETNFTNFVSIQKEFFRRALSFDAISKQTVTPTIGFLPINFSLTFEGLSGIRIFDKLSIESKFLPNNYGDTLEFIITELDHFIENNKWYTRIGTLSIPNTINKPEAVIQIKQLSEVAAQFLVLDDFVGAYAYENSAVATLILETYDSREDADAGPTNLRKAGNLLLPDISPDIPATPTATTGTQNQSVLVSIGKLGGSLDLPNRSPITNVKLSIQDKDDRQFYKKQYGGHYFLEQNAAYALDSLARKAQRDGISFTITSAYRDLNHQARILKKDKENAATNSPHSYGGAIDIQEISSVCRNDNGDLTSNPGINSSVRTNNKIFKWLDENGPKYGWYNPARLRDGIGQDEAWHWEFWGVPGQRVSYSNTYGNDGDRKGIFGNHYENVPELEDPKEDKNGKLISKGNNTLALNVGSPYLKKKGNIVLTESTEDLAD